MKRFLKGLWATAAILGLLALAPAKPVQAQSSLYLDRLYTTNTVSAYISADDLDVAAIFVYVGPNVSGLFTATNATTLTLTSGAAGGEAADTSIECPLAAPYGGVLDVSNAACDTAGELADIVNSTAGSNWRMIILDGYRTDVLNARVQANAARQAKNDEGAALNWDTSTAFIATRALVPPGYRVAKPYLDASKRLVDKPFLGTRTIFLNADETSTYGSGNSFFEVTQVLVDNTPSTGKGSETQSRLIDKAGGATTVSKPFDYILNGLPADKDYKVVLRIRNSAAASAVALSSSGLFFRYPKL